MVFKNLSIQIPFTTSRNFPNISRTVEEIKRVTTTATSVIRQYFFTVFGRIREMRERRREFTEERSIQENHPRFSVRKFKKPFIYLLILGILLLVFVFGARMLGDRSGKSADQIEVKGAKKSLDINKEFSFPLKDNKGNEVAKIKYVIEKAELRDEIILKGERAKAVKGRIFLILNLKIANEFKQPVEIKTRDYVRLSVNGNEEEWLAPDIHNDPVEIQAISTKYTRVGFPINDSDTNLILRLGEIEGEKEKIQLEL